MRALLAGAAGFKVFASSTAKMSKVDVQGRLYLEAMRHGTQTLTRSLLAGQRSQRSQAFRSRISGHLCHLFGTATKPRKL
jgi:hypothetical protein